MRYFTILVFLLGQSVSAESVITETGIGKVKVVSDQAYIIAQVITISKTLTDAISANSISMDRVRDKLGINITTIAYTINEHYTAGNEKRKDGYVVTYKFKVVLNDIKLLGSTVDKLGYSEVATIETIGFSNSNEVMYQDQARTEAINDAIRKAKLIANTVGYTLDTVLDITEFSGSTPLYTFNSPMATAMATNISPNEVQYTISITIKWSIIK